MGGQSIRNKTSQYQDNNIKTLLEQLGSLQIIDEVLKRITEYTDKMSTALVPVQKYNRQAKVPKNMVLDPEQFDRNRTKFKDWQREIRLFLKSNMVMETNNRITVILAHLKGDVANIYAQKKLDKLDKEIGTQNQNYFIQEIKKIFNNKTKAADAEWKIKTFKQEKKNMVDFMIDFEALAMKADIDELYTIFLLKKNV